MYVARLSYDLLPSNRQQGIDFAPRRSRRHSAMA
jgi:hypothetical protein